MSQPSFRESAERNFDDLDADGDGFLTRYDYLALARQRLQQTGVRPDTPDGEALVEAFLNAWDTHARTLDTDRDGEISKEEYVRSFEMLVSTGALQAVLAPISRATFTAADRDGDGWISAEEFRSLWSQPGTGLTAAFARADSDGDGRISYEEFARARHGLLIGEG
ncbi:EF-hand domain-containing protein [Nonomuraea gerenzanensis]|uniref:Calcium binding protein n=1 Tax=Nonomuraea gerenzanensis TaxID=93944 RepID=A0A1M4E6C9_9ACTN|nr:EF-hand domain-containing protein [Nonomuraea gerenzanensis]UBU16509.1 EF-hand domain-containing protein [Nonomuraea gerenzanensis]SBO94332.1 calcium binding protein [Nonomuraea gerenzanensis]